MLVDRGRAADFVADDQQRLAVRAVRRRDERQALGAEVAGRRQLRLRVLVKSRELTYCTKRGACGSVTS